MQIQKMILASVISGVIVSLIMREFSSKPKQISGSVTSGTYV